MENKPELLKCPFCGKEPRYVTGCYVDSHGNDWPFAECDPCHVGSPVEFWNTRAAPAEDVPAAGDEPEIVAIVESALRRSFKLGQIYWQQADSDSTSQQNKSDQTMETQSSHIAMVVKSIQHLIK